MADVRLRRVIGDTLRHLHAILNWTEIVFDLDYLRKNQCISPCLFVSGAGTAARRISFPTI
jgi:hypothetical protein